MDNAVDKSARAIRVGRAANLDEAAFRSQFCAQVGFLFDCSKLQIDLKSYNTYTSVPVAPPVKNGIINAAGFGYQAGAAETIMDLRVYYKWPIHVDFIRIYLSDMADGSHLIVGNAVFKTEPF